MEILMGKLMEILRDYVEKFNNEKISGKTQKDLHRVLQTDSRRFRDGFMETWTGIQHLI